jgi:rare lipoprotein A
MISLNLKKPLVFFLFLLLTSCSTGRMLTEIQTGVASWYGPGFHGKKTANGEKFNKNKLTAAHKTLPFNTLVKVINTENGKSVTVRINDRGPYAKDRIIDLSEAAGKKIGITQTGTAFVKLLLVKGDLQDSTQKISSGEQFSVQLASYSDAKSAEQNAKNIPKAFVLKGLANGKSVFRVYSGKFKSSNEAKEWQRALQEKGFKGFVKQL